MSSLSITDLTSDGEYSVTVAGRDGAGRLGQESEELIIIMKRMQVYLNNSILLCMLVFFLQLLKLYCLGTLSLMIV